MTTDPCMRTYEPSITLPVNTDAELTVMLLLSQEMQKLDPMQQHRVADYLSARSS